MSVRNYGVVSLDELERYPAMSGSPVLMPLRRRLNVRAFAEAHARGEEEARVLLGEMLAREPDAWQPAYNAASFEALAGNADAAYEHLARALTLGPPRVRQLAANGETASTPISTTCGRRSRILAVSPAGSAR